MQVFEKEGIFIWSEEMGLSPKFQWLPILDIVNSFLYVVVVSGDLFKCLPPPPPYGHGPPPAFRLPSSSVQRPLVDD